MLVLSQGFELNAHDADASRGNQHEHRLDPDDDASRRVSRGTGIRAEQIKLVERPVGETTIDLTAKGDSIGDMLVFANGVFDAANKTQVGTDQGYCVRTIVGKSWECFWTLTLKAGQITVEGPFLDEGDSLLAVTGGNRQVCRRQGQSEAASARCDAHRLRLHLRSAVMAYTAEHAERARKDFPALMRPREGGPALAFLDGPGGSQVPPSSSTRLRISIEPATSTPTATFRRPAKSIGVCRLPAKLSPRSWAPRDLSAFPSVRT